MAVGIHAYDHVGIRVTDRDRAIAFYESLGFQIDHDHSNDRAAELLTEGGVRINLIFNAVERDNNILLDEPAKWPGYTHAAFVVDRLDAIIQWAGRNGVTITEGPVNWERRLTCFLRDPDGNVLEFNELLSSDRQRTGRLEPIRKA